MARQSITVLLWIIVCCKKNGVSKAERFLGSIMKMAFVSRSAWEASPRNHANYGFRAPGALIKPQVTSWMNPSISSDHYVAGCS